MKKLVVLVAAFSIFCLAGCKGGGGGGGGLGSGGLGIGGDSGFVGGFDNPTNPGDIIVLDNPGTPNQPGDVDIHPEPSTMLLLGSGLLGMALRKFRKTTKKD